MVSALKFVDRVAPKTPETFSRFHRHLGAHRNRARENLQRLDDDLASLVKYLTTEGASRAAIDALETLSNEVHASWQATVERIEELMEEQ